MHPRTAADFEILYNELEAWRLQETSKIKSAGLDEEAARNALAQLLSKEAKLLQTIDRLKTAANQENKAMRVAKTLKVGNQEAVCLCQPLVSVHGEPSRW